MRLLLIYILLFCCLNVSSQEYRVTVQEWSVKDGMSDREVNSMVQDPKGFLWLATSTGLNFFDGRSFKVYTKEKDGLPFNLLARIVQDADWNLWIMGSMARDNVDNNLFIFDPLTKKVMSFREKTGYKENFRFDILYQFSDSVLFLGNTKEPYFFTWSATGGLRKIPYPVALEKSLMTPLLTITPHKSFWAVAADSSICEVDMSGKLLQRKNKAHISSLYEGLAIHNFAVFVPMAGQRQARLPTNEIEVYGDSARIINHYIHLETNYPPTPHFINNRWPDEVNRELEARNDHVYREMNIGNDGSIWLVSDFSLLRLTYNKINFRRYFYKDVKRFADHNAFRNLVVSDGVLYGMDENKGVQEEVVGIKAGLGQRLASFRVPRGGGYLSLIKSNEGCIFGLYGPFLYTREKDKWLVKKIDDSLSLAFGTWKIAQLNNDSFLLGTGMGLRYLDKARMFTSRYQEYGRYSELDSAWILDIITDRQGHRWVCANTGLYEMDAANVIIARYSLSDRGQHYLPSANFQHLWQDAEGIYWLATADGLLRWDRAKSQYRLFTTANGLSNNKIHAVYEDSMNRLWLSSDHGLMQFDKRTCRVRAYFTKDGISYDEFNRISHTRDSKGNIYFGSLNGVTAFNPADFPVDDTISGASLAVSSFEQFDGKAGHIVDKLADLSKTSSITLKPGDRFFELNFALLSFDDPIHTLYQWKIDGTDSTWNDLKEPSLRVSGLPYGDQTLRIKARASDGRIGKTELRFNIHVIKPVYLRSWFILLVLFFAILAAVLGYRWRLYRLKRENERLDELVKEKTIALEQTIGELQRSSHQKDILMKETHHRVKNNLQVISTLLNLQLSKISDSSARRSLEESASRISSIALMHFQLYEGEQLTSIELSAFSDKLLAQIGMVYLKPEQDIALENKIPETWLDIDTALPLGLILNELMTNSFKYAYDSVRNCRMRISLTQSGDTFELCYCDYGPGLADGTDVKKHKSLGMTIINSLAKQLGGSFSYNTEDRCFKIHFLDTNARKNIA